MALRDVLLLFVGAALAREAPQASAESCAAAMKTLNLTDGFPGVVAHGLHDITVEDLRMFKPDVPCPGNGVPTVNRDLTSDTVVLPSAPCLGDGSPFMTAAMRLVDRELAHMDDPQYDVGRYSGLERMVHAFHMREVWAMALPHYRLIAAEPPDDATCACVRDVEANGVMKMLHLVSRSIRHPDGTGEPKGVVDLAGKQMGWGGNIYKYHFPKEATARENLSRSVKVGGRQMGWDGNIYKYHFPSEGEAAEEPLPRLQTEAAWTSWKELMMTMMDPRYDHDLAIFLYCVLNRKKEGNLV